MSALRQTIKTHLQLMRLSNAPTVISNVLVGIAIGAASGGSFPWSVAAMIALGLLLLYAGGMIMNDVVDLRADRREKPERPIASGRLSARYATMLMIGCLVLGLLCVALAGLIAAGFAPRGAAALGWTVLLLMAIIGYNLLHKKTALSVALMGACRGLVYLVAAAAGGASIDWRLALPPTIAITAYIIALTLAARAEAQHDAALGRRLSIIMILIALAPALVIVPVASTATIVAGLAVIGWLVLTQRHVMTTPPRIGEAVHGWLAAICLIDGLYVCLLGAPGLAVIAWACFAATTLGHRVIAGT